MNIMEIISGAGINGAVVHGVQLTRELARRGHRVTLVCRPGAWAGQQVAAAEVDVIESDLHRWPPDELRRLAGIVRARRIDVLHTHMSRAHFFGVLLRWRSSIASVATAHSRHFQLHWMFNDQVIAVSEATRHFHQAYNFVRPGRIEVIHNFVDAQRFTGLPAETRATVRATFGVDDGALLIGTVGAVIPGKGLLYLVRALPAILAAVPRVRVLVVGERADAYTRRVEATAHELGVAGHIVWTGQRTDVPELMAALDVFVLPSLEENMSLAVLEAMAAGLPVVAAAVGGLPECLGDAGLLVPAADDVALARAVITLLRDLEVRSRLGMAAQQRVRELFSMDRQVPRIERALARAAGVVISR